MEVQVLESTDNPERLVATCARGDYYEGFVGDVSYEELMKNVDYSDEDYERFFEKYDDISEWENVPPKPLPQAIEARAKTEARTKYFIEKQLSRGHYGPFEHPQITFAVKGVPVFTERQLVRHRHLTFDVQSMRYADFSDAPATTPQTLTDATLNREDGYTDLDEETKQRCRDVFERNTEQSFEDYEELVEAGVPKEDARGMLGLSTEVNLTVSGNARSFLHLLNMRDGAASQWSIRQLSELLLDELFDWMPITYNWYDNNRPHKLSP